MGVEEAEAVVARKPTKPKETPQQRRERLEAEQLRADVEWIFERNCHSYMHCALCSLTVWDVGPDEHSGMFANCYRAWEESR